MDVLRYGSRIDAQSSDAMSGALAMENQQVMMVKRTKMTMMMMTMMMMLMTMMMMMMMMKILTMKILMPMMKRKMVTMMMIPNIGIAMRRWWIIPLCDTGVGDDGNGNLIQMMIPNKKAMVTITQVLVVQPLNRTLLSSLLSQRT